ncbi:MAG: peptidoglycan-binding protein [Bryobacteraceae bacterium]|nr:peptidoglycan-binding protein [Bryobacteraceae bacterium]
MWMLVGGLPARECVEICRIEALKKLEDVCHDCPQNAASLFEGELAMPEWEFQADIPYGQKNARVKLVQEWVTYHGHPTKIDGEYGPATELSVKGFQADNGLPVAGRVVNQATFDALVSPMVRATSAIASGAALAEVALQYARQHLRESPKEIGGDNCGPWVRLYMKGREGDPWAWCAGFATTILQAAAKTVGTTSPYPYEVWVPNLAAMGKAKGTYFKVRTMADAVRVRPGYLFLVPGGANFWSHVGIVESVAGEAFRTIEGNSGPSPNGVVSQTRSLTKYDFLVV